MLIGFLLVSCIGSAQFSLTGSYTQDFQQLGTADLLNVTGGDLGNVHPALAGWFFKESGPAANTSINISDGADAQGNSYNFGTVAEADRSLGGMQSGTVLPVFGFWFLNNTAASITSLSISFTGEQWRLGSSGRNDRFDFQYSQNATLPDNGLWLDVDVLDFTAPVSSGVPRALDGNLAANRLMISITIPGLHIPPGTTCFMRWTDFNAAGADDGLSVDDFMIIPGFIPAATGYFRSANSGEWMSSSTWEYSTDNSNWAASSFIPSAAARSITIRNSHNISFKAFLPLDEVQIENGGVCDFSNGILTIGDGPGSDVDVWSGGVLALSVANNPPAFSSAGALIEIHSGGILRVAAGGLTNTPGGGVHAPNFLYRHQSVLEFVLPTAFGSVGVTYFPNADANTIPVFRITQNIGVSVGSVSPTTINGVFEALGSITFANSGHKIFRNGIRNMGTINGSTSGKFIINGHTAELGGTGSLVVPTAGGLEIGSDAGTVVSLTSAKTISGNISLVSGSPGNYVDLNLFDLSVSGTVSGGSITSYIRTGSGTGSLTLRNVTAAGKQFPVGESSFNPLFVSLATGSNDITARVRSGIHDPSGAIPADAVMRTWYLNSASSAVHANIIFGFGNSPGELTGTSLLQPRTMQLLQSDNSTWHLASGNTALNSTAMPGPFYQVSTTAPVSFGPGTVPFALGSSGTVILPSALFVSCTVTPSDHTARIDFEVNNSVNPRQYEIERSDEAVLFRTIGILTPVSNQASYHFTDHLPAGSKQYYRVKAILPGDSPAFSSIVAYEKEVRYRFSIAVSPNPARNMMALNITSEDEGKAEVVISTIEGRVTGRHDVVLSEGLTVKQFDISFLPAGSYIVTLVKNGKKVNGYFIKH